MRGSQAKLIRINWEARTDKFLWVPKSIKQMGPVLRNNELELVINWLLEKYFHCFIQIGNVVVTGLYYFLPF